MDQAKEEVKDEDDEILNPLDMDVEDDEDLLVCLSRLAMERLLIISNSMLLPRKRMKRLYSQTLSFHRLNL
jgi:hypothetical protein